MHTPQTSAECLLCVRRCLRRVLCATSPQSCPTLWPMDCSPPGFSVHRDFSSKNTGAGCHALLLYRASGTKNEHFLSSAGLLPNGGDRKMCIRLCTRMRSLYMDWAKAYERGFGMSLHGGRASQRKSPEAEGKTIKWMFLNILPNHFWRRKPFVVYVWKP